MYNIHLLNNILFSHLHINALVKYRYLASNKDFSRAQIHWLMYVATFGVTFVTSQIKGQIIISDQLLNYNNRMLMKPGYLVRVKRGHYQITDKGLNFLNDILQEYSFRMQNPKSWR